MNIVKTSRGLFYFDPDCTLPDNGVDVICPDSSSTYTTKNISGGGWRTIQPNLVFGSVKFKCLNPPDNRTRDYTDLHLHGHSVYITGNNDPQIKHDTGQTLLLFPSLNYEVSYKYCSSPGRLIRIWGTNDPISPYMLGAVGAEDESNILAWTLTKAGLLNRNVYFNNEFFTQVLEIPHGIKVSGQLRMNAKLCIERMRKDIGGVDPRWGWVTLVDQILAIGPAVITHKPQAKIIKLESLELDGRCFDVDWNAIQNDTTKWDTASVSNTLRNSPSLVGISFGNQNGRPIEGLNVNIRDVHIHDFAGSCTANNYAVRFTTENFTAGNSVSGRTLYYLCGNHRNLRTYGFSRTSVARIPSPFNCYGFRYEWGGGQQNPWPDNTAQKNVLGLVNETGTDIRHGRKSGLINIKDLHIDCTDSPFSQAISFSSDCNIEGYIRNGSMAVLGGQGGLAGETFGNINIITENCKPIPLTFPAANSTANWNTLHIKHVDHRTNRPEPPLGWGYDDAAQYQGWMSVIDTPITISLKRNSSHSTESRQEIVLEGCNHDWPTLGLVHFVDWTSLSPSECISTTVIFRGGRFDNRLHRLIGYSAGYTETPSDTFDPSKYPVKVILDGVSFNLIEPGPFRGDPFWEKMAMTIEMKNCHTLNGELIEWPRK